MPSIKELREELLNIRKELKDMSHEERATEKGKALRIKFREKIKILRDFNTQIEERKSDRQVGNYKKSFQSIDFKGLRGLAKAFKKLIGKTHHDNKKRGGGNPFFKRK